MAGFFIVALLPPAIMFLAAGRTDWWEAWVMVGVLAVTTIANRLRDLRLEQVVHDHLMFVFCCL